MGLVEITQNMGTLFWLSTKTIYKKRYVELCRLKNELLLLLLDRKDVITS